MAGIPSFRSEKPRDKRSRGESLRLWWLFATHFGGEVYTHALGGHYGVLRGAER